MTEGPIATELGALLRQHRTRLGLLQREVANAAGVAAGTWSRVENGLQAIKLAKLRKGMEALGGTDFSMEVEDGREVLRFTLPCGTRGLVREPEISVRLLKR